MRKEIKINDSFIIEEDKSKKRTITSIIENGERKILTDIETDNYFWSKVVFDENYVVVYSRGSMLCPVPVVVEAAYDIKEKRMLDL